MATIKNSINWVINAPYFTVTASAAFMPAALSSATASFSVIANLLKSTPPVNIPIAGITIPSIKADTTLPTAAPITTPTARSTKLPVAANSLNSLINPMFVNF